jgi:site-specific recombinase XerD
LKVKKKYPPTPLNWSEIVAILAACTAGDTGARNKAMIYLLWRCGLRVGELVALRPCDVQDGTVRIIKAKGERSRIVGVDGETAAVVALWLNRRAARAIDGRTKLFCSLKGEPLTTGAVRELLHRLAVKANVETRCTPHQLRHSFSTTAARQIHLCELQAALGHRSLATTQRYVSSLGADAIEAVRRIRWGGLPNGA